MAELEFANLKGETLTKPPGSINGESFTLKNLEDCSVYILDYTSEVEVTNCNNCQIFIGPVDGPAIFDACSKCQVAVACQQFQAKNCTDIEFGLYCATQPSITSSSDIRFGCWMGAYPSLTQHFGAANLDPKTNMWDKAYDVSGEEGHPGFEIIENVHYWEVPIQGSAAPDNPVPAADGTLYSSGTSQANGKSSFDELPSENGHAPMPPAVPAPTQALGPLMPDEDHLATVVDMKEKMRQRLAAQEEKEAAAKVELIQKAATFLESFYQRRGVQKEQRTKDNRSAEKVMAVKGPEGDSEWERTINLINFGFSRPSGSDLSRYKNILFTAKAKNVPIKA
ncbi:hypothetical protein WJX72_010736 [[Myrmecia] bisecta]|uniref:Clathrin light chain n=1 Tax=[Myrmecia] bisecta TaxID=41462 RepID=A0AAW1PH72_9CHLO